MRMTQFRFCVVVVVALILGLLVQHGINIVTWEIAKGVRLP
jgi:hypothetical protein